MFNQKMMYMLVGTALSSMVIPQAMAGVCYLRSTSGACLFYVGSVNCEDLNGSGAGNVEKDPKYFTCNVEPPTSQSEVAGIVYCSNNGTNVAPGVQGFLATGFTGFATVFPGQVDTNGFASGVNVTATATAEQLATLDGYCQNRNWYAIDFVPAEMNVTVKLVDQNGEIVTNGNQTFACTLPNLETLKWDKKAGKPERRQYDCTEAQ